MNRELLFYITAILLCAGILSCNKKEATATCNYEVVPLPKSITPAKEAPFILSTSTHIGYPEENKKLRQTAVFLSGYIRKMTGIETEVTADTGSSNSIRLVLDRTAASSPEGYRLKVGKRDITITGSSEAGIFYGIQTLRKSLPVTGQKEISFPAVQILDEPEYRYRGMHLDVGRHFFSTDFIKKYIDIIALHNLNTFHWHLTDDQGWRIEIKKYPKLTTVGGYRKKTIVGYMWDNPTEWNTKRYGGFYTQEDIKEVVAYAKKRFVEIIPEIEMPGHSVAALTAYPEYSCTGGPFEVEGRWGVFNDIYCTKESTFTFMQDILDEVVELFPSSYIHLGGDEAPRIRWKNCVHCQERMKQEHLTKEAELQTYFINRIENYLNTKGKKIIGWDEILEGGILQRATVMSWRGEKGGIHAAKAGYDVIMSPNIYMYFNCLQSKVNEKKIGNPNRVITLEKVYNYHPVPEVLSADEAKHIKGVQANLWTEYMSALDEMEYMLYPRVAALSEVAWSKKENKDYGRFCTRLESIRRHYDVLGVNYCKKISNE